jgi:hypothetical protein
MAGTTISLEALKDFQKTAQDINLQTFIDGIEQSGQKMANMGDVAAHVGPQVTSALKAAQTAVQEFGNVINGVLKDGEMLWGQLEASMKRYVEAQENAGGDTATMLMRAGLAMDSFLGIIPDGITGMGKIGEAGRVAGTTISEAFKDIAPSLRAIPGMQHLVDGFGRIAGQVDGAYQLQRGLISLAASQGHLSSMVDEGTHLFQGMDDAMSQMSDSAYESAIATGQSVNSMMNLAESLGKIPGALTDNINLESKYASQLVVTSQIATAFGQSQTEVAKTLNTMYDQMGLNGDKAMQTIARLYESAGDSKLRFEGFSKSVMDIASNFKMLGDNTNAATTVVKAFDTAFKDSDISPAAMQQVIGSMTEGIRTMDRGRQAFVSGATGGPGGLGGAFQMELAMQEGRMDEVLSKTMTAMQQQFGGQVLTLKDAAENPALAGEFYKQVQYLTQVAGIAKDDREAYRILEAMQSGVTDILKPAGEEEGQKALLDATERGTAEQLRTTSVLTSIYQILERGKLLEASNVSRFNTEKNEVLTERVHEAIGGSGTSGVQALATTDAFRDEIMPRSELAVFNDISYGLQEMQQNLTSYLQDFSNRKSTISSEGESPFVGIRGNIAREPASPRSLTRAVGPTGRSLFDETGAFPPVPVRVEHSPIEVKVDLGEPFDRAVTTIVRREIQDSNAAQNVRANSGT